MKKKLILLILTALAATVQAYDFTALTPSGHTLGYTISGNNVIVDRPQFGQASLPDPTGSLVIPQTVSYLGQTYTVTGIGNNVFYVRTGLTSVTLPATITNIGSGAFGYCYDLHEVHYMGTIEQWCNITFSGDLANPLGNMMYPGAGFYLGADLVTDLVIPSTVTAINNCAFYGCTSFQSITIGDNVTAIGSQAFANCRSVTKLTLGRSLASIANQGFYLTNLDTVYSRNSTPPSLGNLSCPDPGQVIVPCGSGAAYRSTWGSYNISEDLMIDYAFVSASDTLGEVRIFEKPVCSSPSASIVALPAPGYRFDHWSNGVTANPTSVAITADTLVTAYFTPVPIYPTVDAYDTVVHRDTVVVTYEVHDTATLVQDTLVTTVITTTIHDTATLTRYEHDTTLIRDTLIRYENVQYHTLGVVAPQESALAVGAGTYSHGTEVQIAVLPLEGYRFRTWSDGNSDNPRRVTVNADSAYTALFDPVPPGK